MALSPFGLALLSTCIFLLAVLFPPHVFNSLLSEPDYVFLDVETTGYFALCVAGFCSGLLLFEFVLPSPKLVLQRCRPEQWNPFFLCLPLFFTTLVTCVEIVVIARTYPNILALLMTQEGDAVKREAQNIQLGPLAVIDFMHIAVLWWTYATIACSSLRRSSRRLCFFVFAGGLLCKVAVCILVVSRADLMPVIGGLVVLHLLLRIQQGRMDSRKLLLTGGLLAGVLLLAFFTAGLLRGGGDFSQAGADFLGYTLASYNRLAALVHGKMRYPYGGHGVYLSNYLAYDKRINMVLPLKKMLHWPDFLDLWNSEFQAPQLAGLNPNLIWSGAFGYLFSDFGWTTPLFMIGYGLLYGLVWRKLKLQTTAGYVLYPWFAYCALSWFSVNLLLDNALFVMIVTAILLVVYQKALDTIHMRLA